MASKPKGNNMQDEDKKSASEPAPNEFAPNMIAGAGLVEPAPSPPPSLPEPEVELSPEDEFLAYARGELSQVAREFGYEIVVRKIEAPKSAGPIMLYDPVSREGKVFGSREDAPADFITMDELRVQIAKDAE